MNDQINDNAGIRSWEALLALTALGAFAFAMVQWGLAGVIHSRKPQTVPDLKGRSISAALDQLATLNLGLRKTGTEFDASVPIASVVRQDPPAGTVVREGKIVKVIVSQGGETVLTPSILGLPLRNAEMLLRQQQLSLGELTEAYSLKHEKGIVLGQEPKPETSVERSANVAVSVSAGPPPSDVLLMPDFQRKDIAEAQSWANEHQLDLAQTKDPSSPFPAGVILKQEPAPDAVLKSKSKVTLVVSARAGKVGDAASAKMFKYELSQGGSESLVRIVVIDKYGERELFNGLRKPGSKIELPLQESGGARVKIFLNGILVEERDL